jgi:hypothetical protein
MVLTAAAVLVLVSQYPDWSHDKAVWLAFRESSYRADVVDPTGRFVGLFQIAWQVHGLDKERLKDPVYNTQIAHQLWLERGWEPWPIAASYAEASPVIVDGWLDYAIRKPGPVNKVNGGLNQVKGIFLHSAEGYADGLWGQLANGPVSWHLSNLFDGTLYQHYPLTAQCWHATAANNAYIGMEHEGKVPNHPSLTEAQVATAKRVIADVSAWKGWQPRRTPDLTQTLWEHREVTRLGGTGSACPSGRIPWEKILQQEIPMELPFGNHKLVADGHRAVLFIDGTAAFVFGTSDGLYPGAFGRYAGSPGQPYDPLAWQYLRGTMGNSPQEDAMWLVEAGV